jgi:3-oxoacyl-[acyl-carrier-protein] synthase-3
MTDGPTAAGSRLLTSRGAQHARIASIGSYRPERVVTNDEICEVLDSSDAWIRERTGIAARRFARDDQTVVDLAEPAARQAIERAGMTPGDVDAVLLATFSHLNQIPSAATLLTHRLGCTPAAAMDVGAACAGFTHAISLASDMIRGGSAGTVLVVGTEKLHDLLDPTDRSTAFIFGDGAGAAVVTGSETPGIGPTVWGSDGARWDVIRQTHSWDGFRESGIWPVMSMEGPSVFRWAVWEMAPVARKALDAAGVEPGDLAAFVPHQANIRIIDQLAKQIGLPPSVAVARDVVDSGNTSAASIPLALDRLVQEGQVASGGLALLIGMGAGLSYAAQVVVVP